MVTSAFPNASYYGVGAGEQQWTNESAVNFWAQTVSKKIYDMLRISGSQLMSAVRMESVAMGTERHSFRRLQPGTYKNVTQRHAMQVTSAFKDALEVATSTTYPMLEAYDEPVADTRHVFFNILKYNPIVASVYDTLMSDVDQSNEWVRDGIQALGRGADAIIYPAIHGTAISGHGTSNESYGTVAFSAANGGTIIDHASEGLTREKMALVNMDMDNKGIPAGERIAVITPFQKKDILHGMERDVFTSADFRTRKPLEDNEIGGLMGFEWHVIGQDSGVSSESPTIPLTGNIRSCAFYQRDAIGFAMTPFVTRIDQPSEMDYSTTLHISFKCGAVRREERNVYQVLCQEV